MGLTLTWLSVIILIPLAGLLLKTMELSPDQFWNILASRRTLNALKISFGLSLAAAIVNLVMGTIIVWALVRYRFPGRRLLDAIVDIPFALPTAVAGIALTSLYAEGGWIGGLLAPFGIRVAFTPLGIFVALVFIGLPFVVRTVQPVLADLAHDAEEAALTLGATRWQIFRKLLLPSAMPFMFAAMRINVGFALVGAVVGEFISSQRGVGHAVFVAGNLFDLNTVWLGILELSIVAAIMYALLAQCERLLVKGRT